MTLTFEDKVTSRKNAIAFLEQLKTYERTQDLHETTIGQCTIKCKNKERFKEYEKAIKKPKIW